MDPIRHCAIRRARRTAQIHTELAVYERIITGHQGEIRTLRSQLNACAPVARIPTEILQEIFRLATDATKGSASNLVLGQICRHWRDVALGCGNIWSNIVADNLTTQPAMVEALLLRSRGALLDVRFVQTVWERKPLRAPQSTPDHATVGMADESPESCPEVIIFQPRGLEAYLLQALPRMRSLDLTLFGSEYRRLALLLSTPAPRLRNLSLSLSDNAYTTRAHLSTLVGTLSLHLPDLRTLNLHGFDARFAMALAEPLRSVTSLALRMSHEGPAGLPLDGNELLLALQSMTSLSSLDLGSQLFPLILPGSTVDCEALVDLRHLKNLRLSGEVPHLVWYLEHFMLWPSVNLDLGVFDKIPVPMDGYATLGRHLAQVFFPPAHAGYGTMKPLDHAGCFWTQGHPRRAQDMPSIFHVFISASPDIVPAFHAGINANQSAEYSIRPLDNWEKVEEAFDEMHDRRSELALERTLHIWMIDTTIRRSPRGERVESIWAQLPLQDVHTLLLDGAPAENYDDSLLFDNHQLLPTFLNFAFAMTSVTQVVARRWTPTWLRELLAPSRMEYLVPELHWTAPAPFPSLKSLTFIEPPLPNTTDLDPVMVDYVVQNHRDKQRQLAGELGEILQVRKLVVQAEVPSPQIEMLSRVSGHGEFKIGVRRPQSGSH
ncbi:hypothetical protein EIP91_008961 [Steccherinum ochraceum]|uniref:Uncharacterized protein n=1 Tax=Steccherinum ochraceum TaxID=92696 RepID=A0A4R0RPI6_9APHY|nr:hypothetical protein EIP91_008961 [Steccherinum ochraceum]